MRLFQIVTFVASFLVALSPAWAAKASADDCAEFLANTSVRADTPLSVPQGTLLYYYQKEGIDPFNYFQEGMDPANENPLSVSNDESGLRVSVGGSSFANELDGTAKNTVRALSYGPARQRYLAQVLSGGDGYQILVNADILAGEAHVWMQEKTEGKWGGWSLAGIYTADLVDSNVDIAEAESDREPQPDVAQKVEVQPSQDYSRHGLLGEDDRGIKHLLEINYVDKQNILALYMGTHMLTGVLARVALPEEIAKIIASGKLGPLDGRSIADPSGVKVAFRIDGYDFRQNPRLRVTITVNETTTVIENCNPWTPGVVKL